MARKDVRTVEANIYQDAAGVEAAVRIANMDPRRRRWPGQWADFPESTRARIRTWVVDTRRELHEERKAFGTLNETQRRGGTLTSDVETFLPQIAGRSCFKADRSHLRAWLAAIPPGETSPLGEWDRALITSTQVNGILAQWQTQPAARAIRRVRVEAATRGTQAIKAHIRTAPATSGHVVAAKTIRHRCRLLAELYHTLDGKAAPTPIDEAKVPKVPKTHPPHIPLDVLIPILTKLRTLDMPTFCRFLVFCTTLQRPVQIGRAVPADVNLKDGTWLVRSAKNEPAHVITLEADAKAAWRLFKTAKCWGLFDTTLYGNLIHRAGLPLGYRPYWARHSGAMAGIAAGLDLGDLQGLLGHSSPETTRIYTPFVIDRQRKASKAIDGRFTAVLAPRLVTK